MGRKQNYLLHEDDPFYKEPRSTKNNKVIAKVKGVFSGRNKRRSQEGLSKPNKKTRTRQVQATKRTGRQKDASSARKKDTNLQRSRGSQKGQGKTSKVLSAQFKVFKDSFDEWYWVLVGVNGIVICRSEKGYATKDNLAQAIKRFRRIAKEATVQESAEEL